MKKRISALLIALLLVLAFSGAANAAKQTKAQKEIKTAFTRLLKNCKAYDVKKISKEFKDPSKIQLFRDRKLMAKFIRWVNRRYYNYRVTKIVVTGKTAKAYAVVEYPLCSTLFYHTFNNMGRLLLDDPDTPDSTIESSGYKLLAREKKDFNFRAYLVSEKVYVKYQKIKGKWKAISPSKYFFNAVHCNYKVAYDYYFSFSEDEILNFVLYSETP